MPGPLWVPVWGSVSQASPGPSLWPLLLEETLGKSGECQRLRAQFKCPLYQYLCRYPVRSASSVRVINCDSQIIRCRPCSTLFFFLMSNPFRSVALPHVIMFWKWNIRLCTRSGLHAQNKSLYICALPLFWVASVCCLCFLTPTRAQVCM